MKRIGSLFGMLVVSFALARVHPFGDPQRNLEQPRAALLQGVPLPDPARQILVTRCADCHSNATRWPIYSRMAPVSWLIDRDVVDGRRHLNLSTWRGMPADQLEALETEIAQQTRKGSMPPLPYRLMHWQAALDPVDREVLTKLAPAETLQPGAVTAGDPERGRALFNRRCTGCHATDVDREGPHLRGVYGRRAGSVPGFEYSSAIRKSGVTWTDATLNQWLSDSDAMLPDSAMGFSVPRAQERNDLIAYLKSLH